MRCLLFVIHHLLPYELGMTAFDEFVESGMVGNLWQCCLPSLRKKTIMVNQMRRRVLPGNVGLLTKYRFTIIYGIIYLGDEV